MPKLPAGGNKRRLPDNPTPEMLKRLRMDEEGNSSSTSHPESGAPSHDKGKYRATVEDEDEGQDSADFAPGGDADYFAEEDDEGRFCGGGLTKEQKDILNIFDQAGGDDVREDVSTRSASKVLCSLLRVDPRQLEEMTATGVRRLLTRFERAANKNQDQRSKYPNDPTKCVVSKEATLVSFILSPF